MKTGVPPTAWNARTGLFTPPGIARAARSKSAREMASVTAFAPSWQTALSHPCSGPDNPAAEGNRDDDQKRDDDEGDERQARPVTRRHRDRRGRIHRLRRWRRERRRGDGR